MLQSYGWVEEEVILPVEEVIHTLVILVSALVRNFGLGLGLGPGLDNYMQNRKFKFRHPLKHLTLIIELQ